MSFVKEEKKLHLFTFVIVYPGDVLGEMVLGGSQRSVALWASGLVPERCPQEMRALSSSMSPSQHLTSSWFNKHYKEFLFLLLNQYPLTLPGLGPGAARMSPDQPCPGQHALPEKPNITSQGEEVR